MYFHNSIVAYVSEKGNGFTAIAALKAAFFIFIRVKKQFFYLSCFLTRCGIWQKEAKSFPNFFFSYLFSALVIVKFPLSKIDIRSEKSCVYCGHWKASILVFLFFPAFLLFPASGCNPFHMQFLFTFPFLGYSLAIVPSRLSDPP